MEEDIGYYLDSLGNWNEAMIKSYELGKTHTTQYLIGQWKEVIDHIEDNTSIAVGSGRF